MSVINRKPSNGGGSTPASVGLGNVTNDAQVKLAGKGVANGVASLGSDGKVPAGQLPPISGGSVDGPKFTIGPNNTRPASPVQGDQHYDTTLHKPLWFDGGWRDGAGALQSVPGGVLHALIESDTYTERFLYPGQIRVKGLEIPGGWGLPTLTASSRVWLTYPSGEVELTLGDDAAWVAGSTEVFSVRLKPGTLLFMPHLGEDYTALRIYTP